MGDYMSDQKRHENNYHSSLLGSIAWLQKCIAKESHYNVDQLNKFAKSLLETTEELKKSK
jgi:hypothetical protein